MELPGGEDAWVSVAPGVEILLRCHWQTRPAPALLLLHGLEGHSEVGYMRTMTAKAWARGWHALRMNVRGCGAGEARCGTLYNSGLSGDVAAVCGWALAQARVERLALCGFSMSGNTALKLLGEMGGGAWPEIRRDGIFAAAAISACLDLGPSADALHRRPCRLYEERFLRGLRARVARWEKRGGCPRPPNGGKRWAEIRFQSIREFDERVMSPLFGYAGADDYYSRASAARVLAQIRTPTLVLHAEDDPFIRVTPESRRAMTENSAICFLATTHGGHCAFMNPRRGGDPDVYWAENRALEFIADRL